MEASITRQASMIKAMKKKQPVDKEAVLKEVAILKKLRADLDVVMKTLDGTAGEAPFNSKAFDELLVRKMFVVPSFSIHGGVKGLYDFGPPGCALKNAILTFWREHFVLREGMLEMECTCMTPEVVLKTSGHVERFTDLMVKDETNGECFRADKLLEDHIEKLLEDKGKSMDKSEREKHELNFRKADTFTPDEIHALFGEYGIVSPASNTVLTKPYPFNLMFQTSIGPEGSNVGFLRPETAQGLFVNFRKLLEFNAGKMPFAGAQVGLGFRNEIAPRNGLLRVREFTMAEIEHFVNPEDKSHGACFLPATLPFPTTPSSSLPQSTECDLYCLLPSHQPTSTLWTRWSSNSSATPTSWDRASSKP
jgi:glycyl-tRNA synthetase